MSSYFDDDDIVALESVDFHDGSIVVAGVSSYNTIKMRLSVKEGRQFAELCSRDMGKVVELLAEMRDIADKRINS